MAMARRLSQCSGIYGSYDNDAEVASIQSRRGCIRIFGVLSLHLGQNGYRRWSPIFLFLLTAIESKGSGWQRHHQAKLCCFSFSCYVVVVLFAAVTSDTY